MTKVIDIVEKGKKLAKKDFIFGGSGNISYRDQNFLFITKSGSRLGDLSEKDIIFLPNTMEKFQSKRGGRGPYPSIETGLHILTYQKTNAKAIIHTHPIFSSIISKKIQKMKISDEDYRTIKNREIPVIQNYEPGSKALAKNVSEKLKNKNALIVKNHGVFGKGKTLDEALKINEKIEEIAKKHYLNLFL